MCKLNSFISQAIHLFEVYNLVVFSVLIKMYSHYQKYLTIFKRNP